MSQNQLVLQKAAKARDGRRSFRHKETKQDFTIVFRPFPLVGPSRVLSRRRSPTVYCTGCTSSVCCKSVAALGIDPDLLI